MKLSAEEAKEIMDSTEDYILLDVREEDEYAEGCKFLLRVKLLEDSPESELLCEVLSGVITPSI